MFRDGKTQKQIAEHFGVSPVAIHKRLKRILPPPESLSALSEKEQKFAIEVSKGKTATQAVVESFDVSSRESAKVIGSQLMKKPEVKMAIDELMSHHGLSKSYRVQKLRSHVDNVDPNVSLKALDQSWKLDGSYAPEKNMTLHVTREDLERDLAEIRQRKLQIIRQLGSDAIEEEKRRLGVLLDRLNSEADDEENGN